MLNPPPLEDDDRVALNFYFENATTFVQEFGLMPKFIDELGLTGMERRLFMAKLSAIHNAVLRLRAEEIQKRSK